MFGRLISVPNLLRSSDLAPQEYMVRPPQPAVYMFLFDVSHGALETGYLNVVCKVCGA